MQRTPQHDTAPELALQAELSRLGYEFVSDRSPLPEIRSRADVVFPEDRVAVFVDGCFWHSCPEHATQPDHNRAWWLKKLAANSERDRRTTDAVTAGGWIVVRIWEHESASEAAARISALVKTARASR